MAERLARRGTIAAAAGLTAPVLLRLSLGRWPDREERRAFSHALRTRYVYMPPLLRALMVLPEAQRLLPMVQQITWCFGEGGARPDLLPARLMAQGRSAVLPDLGGNIFTAWTGPPLGFLHLEKCGGIAVMRWLAALFHPEQIDRDADRALPPHLLHRHPLRPMGEARHPLVWGHYDLPALRRLGGGRFLFTILREPRARILSLYDYWRSLDPALLDPALGNFTVALAHRLALPDFLRHPDPLLRDYLDNFYVRRLTGTYLTGAFDDPLAMAPEAALAAAGEAMSGMGFIGITEHMDESIVRLARLIGAPPPPRLSRANTTAANHAEPASRFRRVSPATLTPEAETELDRLTRLDRRLYADACAAFAGQPMAPG